MQNQTLIQILTPVWNDTAVSLNKQEIIKDALNNAGFENTGKYFLNMNSTNLVSAFDKNNVSVNTNNLYKNKF